MSNQILEEREEKEQDFFESRNNRDIKAIKAVVKEHYVMDRVDFLDYVADALDIDVEELPRMDVTVTVKVGNKSFSISGLSKEEEAEDE